MKSCSHYNDDIFHQHFAPLLGDLFEFHQVLWHQKTTVLRLLCGVVCVILRSAVYTTCDGQTDGRTHSHSIYRVSMASRGKNWRNTRLSCPLCRRYCSKLSLVLCDAAWSMANIKYFSIQWHIIIWSHNRLFSILFVQKYKHTGYCNYDFDFHLTPFWDHRRLSRRPEQDSAAV